MEPLFPAPPSPGLAPRPGLAGDLYGTYGFLTPTVELAADGLLKLLTTLLLTAARCQLALGPGVNLEGAAEDETWGLSDWELGLLDILSWRELGLEAAAERPLLLVPVRWFSP